MKKVSIRPIEKTDTGNIVRWRNLDEVRKNLIQQELITEESHLEFYKNHILTKKRYQFIIHISDGCLDMDIGSCFIKDIDTEKREAEFGIFIGESAARGKGYAKYAITELIKFGFDTLNLEKFFLVVLKSNEVAIAVYEKLGFERVETSVESEFIRMELDKESFRRYE